VQNETIPLTEGFYCRTSSSGDFIEQDRKCFAMLEYTINP